MPEPKLMSEKIRETPDYVKTTRVTEVNCSCCGFTGRDDCHWCKDRATPRDQYDRKIASPPNKVQCERCKGTGRRNNIHTITEQKFWCVGGVLGGRRETEEFAGKDYIPFNRASRRTMGVPNPAQRLYSFTKTSYENNHRLGL